MSTGKSYLAIFVAGLALEAGAAAQGAAPSIQIDSHSVAHANLIEARAAAASAAFQEPVIIPSSDGLVMTNLGVPSSFTFQGHVLTVASEGEQGATKGLVTKILYCPSEADDAAYRAAISTAAGGATVDYFDTRVATPSVATMLQYDAVYTWANFAYFDNVGLGNNLASYNNAGGNVVLGCFCTFTAGNSLSGTIMTAAYCPVDSPLGSNHFSSSTYSSGGTTCIYNGVTSLTCTFRDVLVTQGSGVIDGKYADNEICHAYRGTNPAGAGTVVYSNGCGAIQLPGSAGQWGTAVGNACTCFSTVASAWTDEGSALAGITGPPHLEGAGSMVVTTQQILTLSNAAPSAMSALYTSGSSSPTPFKGGTLLPGPVVFTTLLATSAAGGWSIHFRAPAGASGTELWGQAAIQDAAAVQGVSLSNAVKGTTP
jgi:hypothetical protein